MIKRQRQKEKFQVPECLRTIYCLNVTSTIRMVKRSNVTLKNKNYYNNKS